MTKRFSKLFEQWKEMRHVPFQKREYWYVSLSCEDEQIIDSWEEVYNYGYNKSYSDRKE